jgi:tellurite resistance protein
MATADGTTALRHSSPPDGNQRRPSPGARVEHLPVAVFAVVMGLAGTAVAWQRAAASLGVPAEVGQVLAWLAAGVLVVATSGYALKAVRFPAAVRAEWSHPVKLAFVPTFGISLIILAVALTDLSRPLAVATWWIGAAVQFVLTLYVLSTWINDPRFAVQHVHPAWFIPVVGNLVVPLGRPDAVPAQVAWYFFAVGLVYWLALMPLVLGRLVLGGPLPQRLVPTLAVMVAPPAVAALAWVRLGGRWNDPVAVILLDIALFQVLLLASQAPALARVPFALTAWAYSFPLAAVATAALAAGHAGLGIAYSALGAVLLTVLSVLVAGLGARTVLAVRRGEICRPEPS